MKLTKAKLIKLVKPKFTSLGFTEFTDRYWQGFFAKKIPDDLYLTIGLIIHRYYDSMFTANFYLSKHTSIAAVWGDIPRECYQRPGRFLSIEERQFYLDKDYHVEGMDVWWDASDEQAVLSFLRVIELTEPRFINQPGLIPKIEQSNDVKIIAMYAEKVREAVIKNEVEGVFSFLPSNEVNGIPFIWFKAAEMVLKEVKGTLNRHNIVGVAADAYRQHLLSNK